jgi:hypothetical protein
MDEATTLKIKRSKLAENYIATLKEILAVDSRLKILEAEKLVKEADGDTSI